MKKILRIFCKMLAFIVLFAIVLATALMFLEGSAVASARTLPSYEKKDIHSLLDQEEWSEEDYYELYLQTGLGKSVLQELKGKNERILSFQNALFYQGKVKQTPIAVTTAHDVMENYTAPIVPLQEGDVLVTSSCHTIGWRNGHSAIVTNGLFQRTLESYSLGVPSSNGTTGWFQRSANFLVLRLKDAPKEKRAEIAAWAQKQLLGVKYSVTVGIFSPKDQGENPKQTHCSHLVWQAYKHFGYDIDSDGGPVCTTRDIANSPYFEVVQVYGFDPVTLW